MRPLGECFKAIFRCTMGSLEGRNRSFARELIGFPGAISGDKIVKLLFIKLRGPCCWRMKIGRFVTCFGDFALVK